MARKKLTQRLVVLFVGEMYVLSIYHCPVSFQGTLKGIQSNTFYRFCANIFVTILSSLYLLKHTLYVQYTDKF